jgi:hypothetical protein
MAASKNADEDGTVTPTNLKRTLTNPSISSAPVPSSPDLTNAPGLRAAEAFVRPAPVTVSGTSKHYTFDLQKCEFSLTVEADKPTAAGEPTVIFLPEYHFPKDSCVVEVSSGKWELRSDEDEIVLLQRLRWWHAEGEQTIKITGLARRHNVVDGAGDEAGYYDQCNQGTWSNCSLM